MFEFLSGKYFFEVTGIQFIIQTLSISNTIQNVSIFAINVKNILSGVKPFDGNTADDIDKNKSYGIHISEEDDTGFEKRFKETYMQSTSKKGCVEYYQQQLDT